MRRYKRFSLSIVVAFTVLYFGTYGRIFTLDNNSGLTSHNHPTASHIKGPPITEATVITTVEDAVVRTTIVVPPSSVSVTHPKLKTWGRIIVARKLRKISTSGGTKSLHQLHHMLNQMGYNSFYFGLGEQFRNQYSKPMYDLSEQVVTPADLIIIPDAQNSTVFVPWNVARVAAILLGQHLSHATMLKLTRGTVYLPSIVSLRDAFSCASPYTLEAPLDDFFYKKADRQLYSYHRDKENLVLLDCDDKELPRKILQRPNVTYTALGCSTSSSSEELVQLYKKAKVIVDMHLPGRERMLWEAVLFGVCPLVAYHQSGHSVEWALPREWQLDRHDPKQWDSVISRCLSDYNNSIAAFKGIHQHAWELPVKWQQNIDRFFATRSVLFFTVASTSHEEELSLLWALSIFASCPLATVEILIHNLTLYHESWGSVLHNWRAAGGQWNSLHFTEAKALIAQHGTAAAFHTKPRFLKHAQFVHIVPVTALLTEAHSINKLVYQLEEATSNFSTHAYLSLNYRNSDCKGIQVQFTQSERYTWDNSTAVVKKELTEAECPFVDIVECAQKTCASNAVQALRSSLDFALFHSVLSGLSYSIQKTMQVLLNV